eukprot:scaffold6596_cov161-Amphora_coffeaeformis.AAC.10
MDQENSMREDVKPDSSPSILSSASSSASFKASRERKISWEVMSNSNINNNSSSSNSRNMITVQDLPTARPLENEAMECLLQTLESRGDLKQTEGQPGVLFNISVEDAEALLVRGWESKGEEDSFQRQQNSFNKLSSPPQQQSLHATTGKDSSISSASFSTKKQLSRTSNLQREKSYRPAMRHRRTETKSRAPHHRYTLPVPPTDVSHRSETNWNL